MLLGSVLYMEQNNINVKRHLTLKHRFVSIIIINLTFSLSVFAVKFYSINTLFGISNRVTNSICKDDNGFIWASSKTGILRLTDNDYRIYNLPYENAGAIVVTLSYNNSKLIAYTNNGQIFAYNPVYDRFDLVVNLRQIVSSLYFDLYTLKVDHSGDYWIALSSGLYKYHSGKLSLIEEASKERYSITWYTDQQLIITKPTGIWLLDIQSLQSKYIYKNSDISPFTASAFCLDKKQNKLWIGTFSNGLFCYNFNSATLSQILPSSFPRQPILTIKENSKSTILVGIDGQGIWELDKNSRQVLNIYKENADDPYSIKGNGIYDIYCDAGKRVWVCTISGGVSFYELDSPLVNQIIHHGNDANSLVNNDVNGIVEDREGKIWFATNNGISCWDVTKKHWKNFYYNKREQAQVFLAINADDQGRIWAGSYSSGIYVLDAKTGKELAHYSRDINELSRISNFIFDIFKDSQGDLWLGGISGKFISYQSKENKFKTYAEETVSAFAELSPNQILFGGSNGIKLLNKQTGEIGVFLAGTEVQDILVLGEVVWVCTNGEGLLEYNFKNRTTRKYSTREGLPSNFINSIAFANNYLWLGTESGLCRFNPSDKTVSTYASIFPLSGISYNKCALFRLRNGQLACGTNNGVVLFDPQSVNNVPSKGKIFFQDITISGRSIREIPSLKLNTPVDSLQTISLKYFQNTISLELVSIGTQAGSKFSWKMEGIDKDWYSPTDNRIITYSSIPSGKYELKIKLYDSSLSNIIAERSLAIKLVPPFWRRGWFWILVVLAVSGIVFLYFLYYINRLRQEHTEEKIRFFTNTAHDMRTSLTLIKAPVEELSKEKGLTESGRHYLTLAIDQARQLTSVVSQLMDFQKFDVGKEHLLLKMVDIVKLISTREIMLASYAKSSDIELSFVSDRESYVTAVDEPKLEKIIDNLISNAVKYSHSNSKILIELNCSDKKWILQVKDKGIGISKKAQRQLFKEFYRGDNAVNSKVVGSGIGLLLVKNYVTMHGGKVSFTSQENIGSTFQVEIPFKSVSKVEEPESVTSNTAFVSSLSKEVSQQIEPESDIQTQGEMKVLIVEDNDDLLNFMKGALSDEFKIFSEVDGQKAWSFILKQMPDLVVSDIMMPNMDGFQLCKIMKSTYETSHIPIILLTALSEKIDQLHGLGLGADDYITKPFDMNLLIQRIKSIIRNREAVKEKAWKLIRGESVEQIVENDLNDKFLKKLLEVVRNNMANAGFDKEKFASEMNVSTSLLYKKIKSLTDQSPTDFIKTIRLNHALELLQSKRYSVTEVSELCGFASLTYFGIVFKKYFGKSPSEILE
jgi:signal transduction histidine kinase/ligand-binding sensor domain-containing protein/DNA-binding NarL/FixJ family response regulator